KSEEDNVRLLIVCDQSLAAQRLCGELSNCPAEIICVASLNELRVACDSLFDLALFNVPWAELVEYIRTIRESPSGVNSAVLVDSECLSNGPSLVGVLPGLRAMPCRHGDLVKLARRLIAVGQEGMGRRSPGLL